MDIPSRFVNTRPDLSNEKGGDEFTHRCPECSFQNKLHVNDVRATISKEKMMFIMGLTFLGMFVFILILWMMGFILFSVALFSIPIWIWNSRQNKVQAFNKYLVRRYEKF